MKDAVEEARANEGTYEITVDPNSTLAGNHYPHDGVATKGSLDGMERAQTIGHEAGGHHLGLEHPEIWDLEVNGFGVPT